MHAQESISLHRPCLQSVRLQCLDMRRLPVLLVLLLVIGCRGTQAYTRQDLQQVRHAYAVIPPLYSAFKRAFIANNPVQMRRDFRREQVACRPLDQVDQRDTIDPNVNLFEVSVGLDDMCNAIESGYADWNKQHGRPYDRTLTLPAPGQDFVQADTDRLKMPEEMRHPASPS